MAFKGKETVRTKIVINSKIIEKEQHFTYLRCDTTFNYDNNTQNKLHTLQHICDTLIRTL